MKRTMIRPSVATFLLVLAAMPGVCDARAAVEQPKTSALFVKIDGIPGGSTDEQHKGEIEALSFNWSVKLKEGKDGGDAAAAGGGGGTPDPHDALILKPIDVATPKLMAALVAGTRIPQMTVTARGTLPGGNKAAGDYLQYIFTDVRLTVVSHAVITGAQEQVQFRYGSVRVRYVGGEGKAAEETWEVKPKAAGAAPAPGK